MDDLFVRTVAGVFIKKTDIIRLTQDPDVKTQWLATTLHGRYHIKKSDLPMTQRKVTK